MAEPSESRRTWYAWAFALGLVFLCGCAGVAVVLYVARTKYLPPPPPPPPTCYTADPNAVTCIEYRVA
jgi:hypothetical protein